MTAAALVSEPVPAVVGTAMKGKNVPLIVRQSTHEICGIFVRVCTQCTDEFSSVYYRTATHSNDAITSSLKV